MAAWIFQGNPHEFPIDYYLGLPEIREKMIIRWDIRQHDKEIKSGDTVYIWRSQNDPLEETYAGIIAKGKVISDPAIMPDDYPQLWIEKEKGEGMALRVEIKLEEIRIKERLRKLYLGRHDIFKKALIITMPQQTNFLLTEEQAEFIDTKWQENNLGK